MNQAAVRSRNRTARWLTEVFQPPVVVTLQLLVSPVVEAGFPGTIGYGALAALFVCVLPLVVLLGLVRLGKVTDHHVSDRKQRAPVLLMALASVAAGLVVLQAVGAPRSVMVMVLAIVGGIVVLAAVEPLLEDQRPRGRGVVGGRYFRPDARSGLAAAAAAGSRRRLVPGGAPRAHPGAGGGRVAVRRPGDGRASGGFCAAGSSSGSLASVAVGGVGRHHLDHLGITRHGASQGRLRRTSGRPEPGDA